MRLVEGRVRFERVTAGDHHHVVPEPEDVSAAAVVADDALAALDR